MNIRKNKGFTLLEVLLVVAAIAILAGIVILAINPTKQLGETRDAQRWADVNTILNAVYQYSIDNRGTIPAEIVTATACGDTETEICQSDGTCTGITDLTAILTSGTYLVDMPIDPLTATDADGTGYYIMRTANNRIQVCAPAAEQTADISVTR
jgi:type IV pilus assembly protein PilA